MRVSLANSLRSFILYLNVIVEPDEMFVPETDFDLFLDFARERSNIIYII